MAGNKPTTYEFLVRLGAQVDKSIDSAVGGVASKLGAMFVAKEVIQGVKKLNDMLNTVTKNVLVGSFEIAKDSVEKYAELETSVVNAANVFGGTQEQVAANQQRLLETSKELSYQTKYSAVEISDAAYYMGLAGMDITDALDKAEDGGPSNLENMLRLAAVSGEDVVTVIDLITDSMSAMGEELEAINVNKFMDELAITMSSTNTNASQAMEALIKYAATADATGVSMEEQLGLVGVLANRGIKDSKAGTALNSIISRMVGNPQAAKGWAAAGINRYNDDGSFRGVVPLMTELAEKIDSFTDDEQNEILYKVAGTMQLSKVYDILNALSSDSENIQSEFDELLQDIGASGGTLERMFHEVENTYAYQAALLDNNLQGMKLELGQILMPVANEALGFLIEHMPAIRDALTTIGTAVVDRILPKMEPMMNNLETALNSFLESEGFEDTIDNIAGWFEGLIDWISGFDPVRFGADLGQAVDNLTGIYEFLLRLQTSKIGAWLGLGEFATEKLSRNETNTAFNKFARMSLAKGADKTELSSYLTTLPTYQAGSVEEYVDALSDKAAVTGSKMPQDIYELFGMDETIYEQTISALGKQGDDVQRFMDELNTAIGEVATQAQITAFQIQQAANTIGSGLGSRSGSQGITYEPKRVVGGQVATTFATGGIVTQPTLGLIGEAGENEAVIPLSKIGQVVKSVGGSGGGGNTITFSPTITVNGGSVEAVKQAVRDSFAEFEANMAQWQRQNSRRAF